MALPKNRYKPVAAHPSEADIRRNGSWSTVTSTEHPGMSLTVTSPEYPGAPSCGSSRNVATMRLSRLEAVRLAQILLDYAVGNR